MAYERAENAKRTESMELQKAAGDMKLSQLNLLVREQEALLVERQAQLQRLEGEVKTQQRINDNLTLQKSQLEHEVRQCQAKLELVTADKAAREQELSHSKLLIEQAEAKWSMAQRKLDDLVNKNQDLWNQSPTLQRKTIVEEIKKENVRSEVQAEALLPLDSHSSETHSNILRDYQKVKDDLQQKYDELNSVQKRAEISEEEAQSYKKMLDDRDNRLKKLQLDMEAERFSLRKKLEDLHEETLTMQGTISDLQEEVRSLHRAKSSLEQDVFFQNTEVDGLKEQLKITQGEIHRRGSLDQDNIEKISSLEEELTSKQMVINQLNIKCAEFRRLSTSSESDLRALQLHTEALEKEKSNLEQNVKSLKSEIQSCKVQLQEANEEIAVMKRSEQECLFKCKGLEAGIQNCEFVASQLQKKADQSKQANADLENTLKSTREMHDQALMEIDRKDQQIEILKSQVEAAKSQIRIIEGELDTKSQYSHELQVKLQDHSEHVKTLSEQNCTFNSNVLNYQTEITTLKSDLKSALAKKEMAEQKVHMQNSEIDELNTMLKNKNAEIQKGSTVINKHLSRVKALEDELLKYEHNVKGATRNSDKITGNLKQEILILQMEKKAAEKNVEHLNVKVSELSSSLHKVKEELEKEGKDRKNKESIIMQLEYDLQKNKSLIEKIPNSDKSQLNRHHENLVLQREKRDALEKSDSLPSEIILLKENLKLNQAEAERMQKENSLLRLRSQLMEEQVAKCKRMLEELKTKLELQKQGYEKHLMLVQKEMEKRVMLAQSDRKNEKEVSQKYAHGSELKQMLTEYLKEEGQILQAAPQNISESKKQVDIRVDRLEQEGITHDQDIQKARLQFAQFEEGKPNLYSKVNALPSKDRSTYLPRDGNCKMKAKGASSHPGLIESDIKEVQTLEGVTMEKETQNFREQEGTKLGHQYVKDSDAAILKTDNTAMQKLETKCNREQEILQMKSPLEVWDEVCFTYTISCSFIVFSNQKLF
ncbi:desmoplakin-like [Corythoichthys intestinalis]|uniref:desmoplakin-like n=1 Tax=Corythoichthys intestinalis TaxID=161448 RepID=UPI0025A66EFD|nr:desmoplakin-like [Corythoichthys intestinalis]